MIIECRYCGSKNLQHILLENSIHYGEIKCNHCGRWVAWMANPNSPRNQDNYRVSKKTAGEVCKFHDIEGEICFFCLRSRDQLGIKETLTVDHIIELSDGGIAKDHIQNMQVLCSACHKLKNWARLYMNWHLNNKEGERDGTTETTSS